MLISANAMELELVQSLDGVASKEHLNVQSCSSTEERLEDNMSIFNNDKNGRV